MAQWDHYCNAVSIPSLRTDLFLLFLSFSLSFFLLLPFPPIRIFVAFISLVLSFLWNFRYALKARRALQDWALLSQWRYSAYRVFVGLRIFIGQGARQKYDGATNEDFGNLKVAVSTRSISHVADTAQFQRYIQVITSINFGIPVYSWQIYYATGKVYNANENTLQNPCKNNAARKIVRIIDIWVTFPLYCMSNHAVQSNHKCNRWQMMNSSIFNCKILKESSNIIKCCTKVKIVTKYWKFRINIFAFIFNPKTTIAW